MIDDILWKKNCPIIICKYAFLQNENDKYVLQVRMQNISRIPVTSIDLSILEYSEQDNLIGTKDVAFSDLLVSSGEYFGDKNAIPIDSIADHYIFVVKTIGLNSKVYRLDFQLVSFFEQLENYSSMNDADLNGELVGSSTTVPKFIPYFKEEYWYCTCGQFNANDYCVSCGITKKDLDSFIKRMQSNKAAETLSADEMLSLFGDDTPSDDSIPSMDFVDHNIQKSITNDTVPSTSDNKPSENLNNKVICSECNSEISSNVAECPRCGYPLKRGVKVFLWECLSKITVSIKDNKLLRNIIIGVSIAIILLLIIFAVIKNRNPKNDDNSIKAESDIDLSGDEKQNSTKDDSSSDVPQEDIDEAKATIDGLFEKLQQGEFEDADTFLDEPFDFYNNIYQIDDDTLLKLLYSKYSYEIESIDIDPDSEYAFADIKLSHPDSKELLDAQIAGWSFDSDSMPNALKTKLNSNDLTISTNNIQLPLSRDGNHWVIYTKDGSFRNMLNYGMTEKSDVNTITENEKRIAEKKEYIEKNIVLSDYIVEECEGYLGRVPGIHYISIKNNGDQDISSLSIGLDFLDDAGKISHHSDIQLIGGYFDSSIVKAGYSWKMEDGKFYEIENIPSDINLSKVNVYVSDVTLTKPKDEDTQSPTEQYIEDYLEVSAKVGMDSSYHGTVPGISDISIKNNGDRDIKELTITVYFQDDSGKNIAEDSFMVIGGYFGGDILKANYSWKMENNKFYEFEHLADEVDVSKHTVEISSVSFN